jgi:hypothetical protein
MRAVALVIGATLGFLVALRTGSILLGATMSGLLGLVWVLLLEPRLQRRVQRRGGAPSGASADPASPDPASPDVRWVRR